MATMSALDLDALMLEIDSKNLMVSNMLRTATTRSMSHRDAYIQYVDHVAGADIRAAYKHLSALFGIAGLNEIMEANLALRNRLLWARSQAQDS